MTGTPRQVGSSRADRRSGDDGSAIELDRASVRLGGRTIWSDVSMSMARGEFVALLGANGSGKSTLLRAVLGALAPAAGRISVLGRPAGEANSAIGYLPQRRSFDGGTRLRGLDVVRLGLDGDRWGLPLPLAWGRAAWRAACGPRNGSARSSRWSAQASTPSGRSASCRGASSSAC